MAGGKGERLRPLTLTRPKPLLEIDGKAIIDYNVEALAACGISDITVSTRYLAEQLYEHFSTPIAGVQVKCITEDVPLGTIGAAALIEHSANGNTLVMNSDLLTTISFEDMYMRHNAEQADITIAAIPYQVSVPFAILTTQGHQVTGIEEKPSYSYFANAGIYIIRNSVLQTLQRNVRTDATDLIESTIKAGGKVVYYPINGTWLDVGSHADFAQAQELMRHHRNLSIM
jgi:NDP-sugar pyrophosphorylase family protein